MENGGREGDLGSESDEENDSQKNTSDTGRTENSRESRKAVISSSNLAHVLVLSCCSSRLDSNFQGLQRDYGVAYPSRVGQLSWKWSCDGGNWLGQFH